MKKYTKDKYPPNAHRNARQRKIYKERRKEIIEKGNGCVSCGEKNGTKKNPLIIHHALHHGLELCPYCKSGYKRNLYPSCWKCSQKLSYDARREHINIYHYIQYEDKDEGYKRLNEFWEKHEELFS